MRVGVKSGFQTRIPPLKTVTPPLFVDLARLLSEAPALPFLARREKEGVSKMNSFGIFGGITGGIFRPNSELKIAEFPSEAGKKTPEIGISPKSGAEI